jgi:ABC-type multidrug transport system ATPase subunit
MPKYIVMDEPNANLDEVGESALVQAVSYLKSQGSSIVMTTHRPRLVSVVDKLLVLRNGQQVGFGPADEMINAVRNLQVVAPTEGQGQGRDADTSQELESIPLEATNDAPVYSDASPDLSAQNAAQPQATDGATASVAASATASTSASTLSSASAGTSASAAGIAGDLHPTPGEQTAQSTSTSTSTSPRQDAQSSTNHGSNQANTPESGKSA